MDIGAKDEGVRGGKRIGHNQSIKNLQCARLLSSSSIAGYEFVANQSIFKSSLLIKHKIESG
jgi:hypothetical protein